MTKKRRGTGFPPGLCTFSGSEKQQLQNAYDLETVSNLGRIAKKRHSAGVPRGHKHQFSKKVLLHERISNGHEFFMYLISAIANRAQSTLHRCPPPPAPCHFRL
jgi:hypothetical protein